VTRNVLVIGGGGFFGARIAASLAGVAALRVLIGGRDAHRARSAAIAAGLPAANAVVMNAADPRLADALRPLDLALIIHAAGPFQGQNYDVARAAVEIGCHYVDLADGRGFVAGIETLDAEARARGVAVISGASSVPALSSAVVDRYLPRFDRLDSIEMGISSGARAPGLATVEGVFSYGGKAVRCWNDGAWTSSFGWRDLSRHHFPSLLGARWLSTCDIPDLELFPKRYAPVRSVSFKAGFASDLGHLVVFGLAGLVKAGLVHSMRSFAAPLNRASRLIEPLVSDRGGMFVALRGKSVEGGPLAVCWNLLAAQNHGPYVPCGAAIALARQFASGARWSAGARPCMGLLTVDEYLEPLRTLDIREVVTEGAV
jgi:saccharopine dehydrogenase-like NADP-dependent oxidoreductase